MYNVLIVDDQASSQDFMKFAIMKGGDKYNLIGTLKDADNVNAFLYRQTEKVDLVLLDIYTNGKENGIDAAVDIKALYPNTKIIILTFSVHQTHIDKARKGGCEAFCYKDYIDGELVDIIDRVMRGEIYYPDNTPVINIGRAKSTDFTKQELKVLQAKTSGYSNAEICEKLNIKPPTLDTHIRNLKTKTGYDNMLQLVSDVSLKRFIISER